MQLDKNMIVDLLRQRGDQQSADRADQEFPDQVTPTSTPACWSGSISTPRSWRPASPAATCPASDPDPERWSASRHGRRHRRRTLDANVETLVQVGRRVGDEGPTSLADEHAGRVGRRLPVARLGLRCRMWLGHLGLLHESPACQERSSGIPARPARQPARRVAETRRGSVGRLSWSCWHPVLSYPPGTGDTW
jgi:hypothetical protein